MNNRCPIGSLGLHTMNHERTECIWCGPNQLAWAPGHWVDQGNGTSAWSATPEDSTHVCEDVTPTTKENISGNQEDQEPAR